MILEFIQSLLSDAPSWAKKQSLVRESIAILARYRRQKNHWHSHLENCQNEILKFCEGANSIAVLGSGYLLDFPVELLNRTGCRVYLLDAVHPKKVKSRKYLADVAFTTVDLNSEFLLPHCDRVVSLNVLSQLALMPFLKDQDAEAARTRAETHVKLLKSFSTPALLLTDFEKRFLDKQNKIILAESTLHELKLPTPYKKWIWDLAPFGEISKDYRVELQVGAWKLN